MKIEFILNGKPVQATSDPSRRLLDVLRLEMMVTGPKEGCGEGECGACSVLVDGKIANSCIVPLGSIRGRRIETIEGLMEQEEGQALLLAFEEAGAVQCGICTPGMIIAAASLLRSNPQPTETEVRAALSGNLCRCTGYNMIVSAILMVAQKGGVGS